MTDYSAVIEPVPTPQREHDRPSWIKRNRIPIAALAGAFIVGIIIGNIGDAAPAAEAKPLPAKTVEVEVEKIVEVSDETCKRVAQELFSQLGVMANEVVSPLTEAAGESLDAVVNNDIPALEAATVKTQGANAALTGLTSRIEAIGSDYSTCVG
jgi:hypothetical protein